MTEKFTVSVQIAGYENSEQLSRILQGVLLQHVDFPLEINVINNQSIENLEEFIHSFPLNNILVNILERDNDFYGVTKAHGKYLAFCCFNDFWNSPEKLKKQIDFLETNKDYSACVHDVCVIDSKARIYRYALQRGYKKQRFSLDKIYSWSDLQKFILPGAISTLVCHNIFQKETVSSWISSPHTNSKFCLYMALILEGQCYNFHREQLATRYCKYPLRSNLLLYKYDDALKELDELNAICEFAEKNYHVPFDVSYRLIQIASLNFEVYKKSNKNPEMLDQFMELYEKAYRYEYDQITEECHSYSHEKAFFEFLRGKVYWYQLKKGNPDELKLLNFLFIPNDEVRIERILQCYRYRSKATQCLKRRLIQEAENPEYIKSEVHKRLFSAPYRKVKKKIASIGKKGHRLFKRLITNRLRKQGFSSYMANEWYDSVRTNLLTDKTTPLKDKLWCYKRGFMPWRLFQYGINNDNYKEFLSDRDYMYLHQINNSYKKWIEDKMTFRYVLEPFKEYLPKYYYQIFRREGYPVLLPLMDCPVGYDGCFDDLFRLLRDKGALALKAASGTHGIGFYKMSYENGKYFMNNEESSEYEIREIIRKFKNFYIITEYINMHDEIKRLYPGSVNTIRIMVLNRDGINPQLLDAYMRIGSSTTGTTDNVAFGGVFCRINIETGHYDNPEQSNNHVLVSCPYHPDTNALIEGDIPNWNLIKQKILEMCNYIGQLEYLGFDVVCTPDGFIVLEINSHQDLHRYLFYDQKVKQFFFDKLAFKHKLYKK